MPRKPRDAIDRRYRWDPSTVFPDEDAWERAADRVDERIDDLDTAAVTTDATTLADALDAYFDLRVALERVNVYASLRTSIDAADERAREMSARASDLESRLRRVRTAIESEIRRADRDRVAGWIEGSEALSRYEHYLDDLLRRVEHAAEPAVEAALSTLEPALGGSDRYRAILDADLSLPTVDGPDGGAVELTASNRRALLRNPDRAFRRRVHERFYDALADHRHAIAGTFRDHVQTAVRTAALRGYDSSLEAALDGECVPTDVYAALVDAVRDRLDPHHEHLRLKRQRLGVDRLRPWDVEVGLADGDPTISYEEAKGHVLESVAPLGDDYRERLARGLESGWVDVYETPGKAPGAFTIPAYGTHPWVLLNYQNDVASLFALAHEAGHAMHAALASESQPMVYGYADRFVAEIPSTLGQVLLARHLSEADDPTLRRAVRAAWLECLRGLLFRRARYAICERRMHERVAGGAGLTAEFLDRCVREGWEEFCAPVCLDERTDGEWMHTRYLNIYDEPFFVYTYATGASAALALADSIREEAPSGEPGPAPERYRRFLRRGSSGYPLELLADAGVDLASGEPVDRAVDAYAELVAAVDAAAP